MEVYLARTVQTPLQWHEQYVHRLLSSNPVHEMDQHPEVSTPRGHQCKSTRNMQVRLVEGEPVVLEPIGGPRGTSTPQVSDEEKEEEPTCWTGYLH